jgi:Predicted dinucleotide-binding enzymes
MAHVSIIGTGNMGQAIAAVATKGGHTVELIEHSAADKPVTGEVVVLAVPYPAVSDVLARRGGQLAGKVVVDYHQPAGLPDVRLPDRAGRRLGRR